MWCEIDDGRAKKLGKRSFHVVAVIEVDRFLDGRLGIDTSVMWAIEVGAVISKFEGDKYSLMRDDSEDDWVGMCQWLVGVGPKNSLAFWSVHCLDDISPLRFPRVNLWKKLNLLDFSSENQCSIDHLSVESSPISIKTIISRTKHFGPPKLCNLVQLRPDNSISFLEGRERRLSCLSGSVLSQDGHTGTILQVAISPCSCDISLCASLDCYGWLLLWSHSSISNCILGAHRIGFPTWKLIGKVLTEDICTSARYSSLCWAPSRLGDSHVLLLGHEQGIDFLLIKIPGGEGEEILCQKVGMISFGGHVHEEGLDKISVTPLPSICGKSFISNCFMLLGIWMKGFSALSWKVELHSTDLSGEGCGCSFRKYYVSAVLCSSKIPEPHYHNLVTSFATVCPAGLMPSVHQLLASQVWQSHSSSYHMATGYCDGTVKLWRINFSESLIQQSKGQPQAWELVGMFMAHRGPVNGIALSSCGSKIASVSFGTSEGSSCLYIWEPTCLVNTGKFFIEECLFLDGVVIAMNWLSIGNGQLLLGVCMANELRIYSQKRQEWVCISQCCTSHMARNFLWGPGATLLLVHQRHFSNFGQWSFNIDKKNQAKLHLKYSEDHTNSHLTEDSEQFPVSFFAETGASGVKECLVNENGETFKLTQPATNATVNGKATNSCLMTYQEKYGFGTKNEFHSMLEIAYELRRPLPIYHPRALLLFMNTGNWKRAYAALQHLGGYLNSDQTSNMSRKDNGSIFPEFYLSKHYEENFSSSDHNEGLQWGGSLQKSGVQIYGSSLQLGEGNSAANASENIFSSIPQKSEFGGIVSSLEKKTNCIRDITEVEKMQIFAIVDLLGEVSDPLQASPYGSFDEPGRRFWVAVRFQHLQFIREFGRVASVKELVVDSKAVAWAFQSDCQDNLFASVLPNDPSWVEMRNMGVGFWFTNITLLRARMEKLARLQYIKKKDPKDCALLYLALNRLQVLVGLFKISRNEKDRPLVGFLSRNFQEEKNKAAALKNAYVLLGKHQLELAIAFFLLGGDPSSAITVCAKNLGDPQLAIVICRLLEGYGGKLERHLISSYLLPNAIEKTDYWLSSLLEWTLGNYTQSFNVMLSSTMDPTADEPDILHSHLAFSESDIGQYCTLLANRNSLRSSIGEHMAASLLKCGLWMTLSALNKCGLPLEALDCVSTFLDTIEGKERADYSNFKKHDPTLPCSPSEGNWMLADVAFTLELHVKLSLAMQCLSRDEMWHLLGACLWGQLYNFFQCELSLLFNERHKDGKSTDEQICLFPVLFSKLKINLTFIYSSLTKNLASFLRQKLEKGSLSPTLVWLEESDHSSHGDLPNTEIQGDDFLENFDNGSEEHLCKLLWKASVSSKEVIYFHNPREVYKRNGELLEAMCFNSIDHQEVALASNRKGILFFNWKRSETSREMDDYIWSESDWPRDGWAGSVSTPIPTFVSPGVGLGSKKGAHLGLGGATFGLGTLARPGKDLTGGGAFGIPGYAGMGASGLGWGEQEDFEEFVDPPATVENISTRSLSSHPSRPFFLVGSSNTHVYLWEFGKYRATATYGVLPAANVPPPYALASISALQFDHCGHRFASAALDGTVCTWQLEVGGRSNVCPTESSLCFNSHASDVSYLAASGSVLAVAGCSSNGVNVVIWDVLAPPATSQASLVCHEGGARSLSVFDNEVGSGSISPLIVTGGKAGDVGLHDFRFIATGRTKRQKGSIARITTIPNTSLFLTGGKDGDVKLWDAKKSELVFHWPKLHDRHTFLQPSSRGFGGIVRAAVTDIKPLPHGFLSCGGDGGVRHVQLQDFTNRSSS
ncbi:hypothetical protein QJS04_geneDACA022491 [Acorus gramineus]|uniref:RAVE complex protein Rav1 C-terminal domain-containing protein n=1 Tax=Acorus gramineus TaxID=55184 RepID=A0AAV9BEG1_ACOGR|nr:hypothetical protein QJS04_geneDACA022491 [Acorus gramineus]